MYLTVLMRWPVHRGNTHDWFIVTHSHLLCKKKKIKHHVISKDKKILSPIFPWHVKESLSEEKFLLRKGMIKNVSFLGILKLLFLNWIKYLDREFYLHIFLEKSLVFFLNLDGKRSRKGQSKYTAWVHKAKAQCNRKTGLKAQRYACDTLGHGEVIFT